MSDDQWDFSMHKMMQEAEGGCTAEPYMVQTIYKECKVDRLDLPEVAARHYAELVAERDALKAENERLREALREVDRHLTNLQPHIPQSCKPGHEGFIDSYVDPALDAIRAALDKAATLAALQEKTDG